jgi:hypothetical protein
MLYLNVSEVLHPSDQQKRWKTLSLFFMEVECFLVGLFCFGNKNKLFRESGPGEPRIKENIFSVADPAPR